MKWKNDFVLGLVCMGASGVWVVALRAYMPDDIFGLVVLLGPFGILLLTGAFFLSRGQFRQLLRWYPPRK